jgi:hypothetical protein
MEGMYNDRVISIYFILINCSKNLINETNEEDMSVPCMCHCQHMGHLVFCQLGGRRSNMCTLSIHHNSSSLCIGDIKLQGGHMGLIFMKEAYIEMLVEAGMGHISKSLTV